MCRPRCERWAAVDALLLSLHAQAEHLAMERAGFRLEPRATVRILGNGSTSLRVTWTRHVPGAALVVRGTFPVRA